MRGAVAKRSNASVKGAAEEVWKLSLSQTAASRAGTLWRNSRDLAWIFFSGALFWTIIICASFATAVLVVVSYIWHSRPLGLILSSSFRQSVHSKLRALLWFSSSSSSSSEHDSDSLCNALLPPLDPTSKGGEGAKEGPGTPSSKPVPCSHISLPLRPPCHIEPFSYPILEGAPVSPRVHTPPPPKKGGGEEAQRSAHVRYSYAMPEGSLVRKGTVVLLHGVSMTCDCWPAYINALTADGWAVLAYDFWGHGDTAVPLASYTPDLLVRQLADLLDALSVSDQVHIVGYSLGSLVGLQFAATSPSRVASLTLIAPAAGLGKATEDFTGEYRWLNILQKGLIFYARVPLMPRVCTWIGNVVLGAMGRVIGPTKEQLVALHHAQQSPAASDLHPVLQTVCTVQWFVALWLWQHTRSPRHKVLESFVCEGNLLADATYAHTVSAFSKRRLPLFLIFGDKDPLVPPSVQNRCRTLFPRAKVLYVPGAGHALLLHGMHQVRGALVSFLGGSYAEGWEAQ